jgi:hypothetical protein
MCNQLCVTSTPSWVEQHPQPVRAVADTLAGWSKSSPALWATAGHLRSADGDQRLAGRKYVANFNRGRPRISKSCL